MKIAVVVQRYGSAINGGAELHARYIAEHLARHAEVEVLTTCATDYVTWRNELPADVEQVNGVSVRRFRVKRERDPHVFAKRSDRVFLQRHSLGDELDWLDAEGPTSPALVDHVAKHAADFDFCLFFSYRYYHAYYGARAATGRAILVPTAERDHTIGLSIFQPLFRSVRAVMYNSPEEQAMINAVSHNEAVPGVVVGIGSNVPAAPQPNRFRQKHQIRGPFAVYVGRIDQNKGCTELFEFFQQYLADPTGKLSLVLIGNSLLEIPSHPRIRHLGFLDDADKFDAMAAADLLIMPSYYESLSMVTLEAWALGRPVLANGKCDVLKGQCIRSNAGLYYESTSEFIGTLEALEQNRWLAGSLGRNGRQFFKDQYDWPVIERKYLDIFARLKKETPQPATDPLPGWFDRRRQDLPPAEDVLARLPKGPAVAAYESGGWRRA
ncbi:MAG TPA: glycosyltransferase family 4 protein [Vicinamibacterales bacterium]|nr:glycosyltransferase family 4 protein [Vicinamibacterales bacterium]